MSRDLHQALDTAVIDKHGLGGVNYVKVRLQHGKTDVTHSLHAEQTTFNLSGRFTEAHLLHRLGFAQSQCAFVGRGQCVAKEVPEDFNIRDFASTIEETATTTREGLGALLECGFFLENTLFGTAGMGPIPREMLQGPRGDGHNAAKKERMKESEDEIFTGNSRSPPPRAG